MAPMSLAIARDLLAHALPILIAQLSAIGMMVVDTAVLGHVGATDLAAVAIGSGIHVSVVFALVGILQAVAPLVAQAHGAGRQDEVRHVLQQAFLLAVLLVLPGVVFLLHPGGLLALSEVAPEIEEKVRAYLALLAWGLLPALLYRTFYFFCNALGRPRVLMFIGLAALLLHAVLAWGFAARGWLGAPTGVVGCALANVLIAWLAVFAGLFYLHRSELAHLALFAAWRWPDLVLWRRLLRLGLPMGISNFVEITSFTLIALFIAGLGATTVAGHRIVANLAALSYMLPLSLGIATLSAAGFALGRQDQIALARIIRVALVMAGGLAMLVGISLWLGAEWVVAPYTDDLAVRTVAFGLIPFFALYQFFDALQTIAAHALRACHVTFLPMLVQTGCFWGIGLAAGWWLCYQGPQLGVAGFWLASLLALMAAAGLLLPMLGRTLKALKSTP